METRCICGGVIQKFSKIFFSCINLAFSSKGFLKFLNLLGYRLVFEPADCFVPQGVSLMGYKRLLGNPIATGMQ
jgi:hypothetical protein